MTSAEADKAFCETVPGYMQDDVMQMLSEFAHYGEGFIKPEGNIPVVVTTWDWSARLDGTDGRAKGICRVGDSHFEFEIRDGINAGTELRRWEAIADD